MLPQSPRTGIAWRRVCVPMTTLRYQRGAFLLVDRARRGVISFTEQRSAARSGPPTVLPALQHAASLFPPPPTFPLYPHTPLPSQTSGDPGISAFPEGDNLLNWVGTIHGGTGTVRGRAWWDIDRALLGAPPLALGRDPPSFC